VNRLPSASCKSSPSRLGGKHKAVRLPAHDVEKQVILRLQSFLRSNQAVMDDCSLPGESPALTQRLIAAAVKNSKEIDKDFLTRVVARVVVHDDQLVVAVSKEKLRAVLVGDRPESINVADETHHSLGDPIRLEVRAQLRRHGGEMRLVVPADSDGQVTPPPVSSLLKAVARGRQWHEWIVNGEVSSQRSIATRLGLNERYVGRVLQCSFLAPDIVETILDGRQPSDLTFQKLTCKLPLSWVEQRQQLGFSELRQRPHSERN
jgi:site-specific DNA recombinase